MQASFLESNSTELKQVHVACGIGESSLYFTEVLTETAIKLTGFIYTTIMALGAENHDKDGLVGPTSTMVVYVDPLGFQSL